jgi:hypothetical protein
MFHFAIFASSPPLVLKCRHAPRGWGCAGKTRKTPPREPGLDSPVRAEDTAAAGAVPRRRCAGPLRRWCTDTDEHTNTRIFVQAGSAPEARGQRWALRKLRSRSHGMTNLTRNHGRIESCSTRLGDRALALAPSQRLARPGTCLTPSPCIRQGHAADAGAREACEHPCIILF